MQCFLLGSISVELCWACNVWESSSLVMCYKTTPKKKNKRKRALEGTPPNKAGKKLKDNAECTVYIAITCHICEDPIY